MEEHEQSTEDKTETKTATPQQGKIMYFCNKKVRILIFSSKHNGSFRTRNMKNEHFQK